MFNLSDSHTDLLTAKPFAEQIDFIHNLPKNVEVLNLAVFTTDNKFGIKEISEFKQNLNNLQKNTNTHLLFSIEDIGTIHLNEINKLITLTPFCVSLTWNKINQYAGGSLSTKGLTKCGKETIKKLEENNILIDTAHLNRKSFWQFAKVTTKPILCTHANINSLFHHPRNLTDNQIQKIVESNGFLGLTLYDRFISKHTISAKDVALQFDYLIKKFGHQNFGFGTDFFGINENNLPINIKNYKDMQLIASELKKHGYSNEIIKCIFHENFINFLNRTNNLNL